MPSPVIATSLPPACSCLMSASLSSGVASVGSRLRRPPRRWPVRSGIVPGDHHRANPHFAHFVESFAHPLLDNVFEMDHAEYGSLRCAAFPADLADDQRVPPAAEMPSTRLPRSVGTAPPWLRIHSATELAAPLRSSCPLSRLTRTSLVVAENSTHSAFTSSPESALEGRSSPSRIPRWNALGRFVGKTGELSGIGQLVG